MIEKRTSKIFSLYFVFLLFSTMLFSISGSNSIVMYAGYCASILFLLGSFFGYFRRVAKSIFVWGFILAVSGMATLGLNAEHVFDSVRSIGININIIIPFLYMILIGALAIKKMRTETINRILLTISAISFAVSVITIATNVDKLGNVFSYSSNAYAVALRGFFPNKNMFGDFAAMGAVISLYCMCVEKKRITVIATVFQIAVTILTLCRAALLFLGLFCIFFGARSLANGSYKERRQLKKIVILALIALVAVIVLFLKNSYVQYFILDKLLRVEVGDAGRTLLHDRAKELLLQSSLLHWAFGYGASGLEHEISGDLHNTYLNVLLTGGVVRLLLYLYGIYCSFAYARRIRRKVLSNFCISCLFSYLVYACFETVVYFELGLFSFEILFVILIIPFALDDGDEALLRTEAD